MHRTVVKAREDLKRAAEVAQALADARQAIGDLALGPGSGSRSGGGGGSGEEMVKVEEVATDQIEVVVVEGKVVDKLRCLNVTIFYSQLNFFVILHIPLPCQIS